MTLRNPFVDRLVLALVLLAPGTARAQTLAFPGAEGFGRFATGARTNLPSANVYHVTNLNESGPGSFRDAVSQPNRFVVFDVGGIIHVPKESSPVAVSANVTIAAQTAPGGIVVYGNRVTFSGANNTVARYLGVHKGEAGTRDDASGASNGVNMMFDHMSVTWGVDETFSLNWDGKGSGLDNISIQDSIIAQGQDRLGHSAGGLMTLPEGSRFSVIRSLFADNVTRNPKVRGENEFINNVVYGWQTAGYIMGDTTSMDSHANVVGNYFIESTVDGGGPFSSGTPNFHIYAQDNWVDANRNGVLDGVPVTSYPGADVVATPFAFPTSASMTAQQAVGYVMQNAGLSIVRDPVDARLMQEVASYGTLGGIIQRETDLFPNYATDPQYRNPRARFTDADNDGIADNWEAAHGLSSSNATDWKNLGGSGYTRLEEYVNELGAPGEVIPSAGGAWSNVSTWGGALPTLADDAVVVGNLTQASGHAFARRLSLTGSLTMSGGSLNVFDTATLNGSSSVSNSTASLGRVLLAAPGQTASLVVTAGGTLQTGTVATGGGTPSLTFNGGRFRAAGAVDVSVPTTLGAGGATFDTAGYSGRVSGAITGAGGLTKQGAGELLLTGANSFSGPTVVEGGSLKINSAAALGGSTRVEIARGAELDVSGVSGGYTAGSGKTITGAGVVSGNLTTASGSVLRPDGLQPTVASIVVTPSADTYVRYGIDQGVNYGSVADLVTRQNDAAPRDYMAYIRFDLSSVTTPITDATFAATRSAGDSLINARVRVLGLNDVAGNTAQTWSESGLTWNTLGGEVNTAIYPGPVAGASPLNLSRVTDFEQGVAGVSETIIGGQVASVSGSTLAGFLESRRQAGGLATLIVDFPAGTTDKSVSYASRENASLSPPSLTLTTAPDTYLTIAGNFTQAAGSTLDIQIDGQDFYNTLVVTSTATLSGNLSVSLAGGFVPQSTDQFVILDAQNLVGQFQGLPTGSQVHTADGSGSFSVNYDYANDVVVLTGFQLIGVPGDYNDDGQVNAADYVVWRDGDAPTAGEAGYTEWRDHFGATASAASQSAPEPTALGLAALAAGASARRRRRG